MNCISIRNKGDQNITQKLGEELKRKDWKLLILHFLGLDHIGHVEGPFSSKVPVKLKEMDTNIMQIDLAISEWVSQCLFVLLFERSRPISKNTIYFVPLYFRGNERNCHQF